MAQSNSRQHKAALALARRGFLVFPIAAGHKHPPLVKFKQAATRDLGQVEAWWEWKREANIGIHCAGLLVLDVDPKRDGLLSWGELKDRLPKTWTVATPSGGLHAYFTCDAAVGNSVGKVAAGVDVRSTGGYVVGPGSETAAGRYKVTDDSPVAKAPPWLVELCQRKRSEAEQALLESTEGVDPDLAFLRACELLEATQPAVEGQGGDAFTYEVICRVRDMGVEQDQVIEVLADWNDRCEPPWSEDDLERKVANAYRYAQNEWGCQAPERIFEKVEPASEEPKKKRREDKLVYGPEDVTLDELLDPDYLVKGWLNRKTQALMFGPRGASKTFVALHLCACIASGNSWFGRRMHQHGVFFAGYEGQASLARRLYALRQEYPDWDLSKFRLRPFRHPMALPAKAGKGQKAGGQVALENALLYYKQEIGHYPGLIVIDPLRNALGGSDSDPDLTAPYLNYLEQVMDVTGAAVLTIHHPGHSDQDRARGDSGIEAHMDTIIRVDGDRGLIETSKQRDEAPGAVHYRLRIVELGTDVDGDPLTTCLVEEVTHNPLDPTLTDTARTVLDAIKRLVNEDDVFPKSIFTSAAAELPKTAQAEAWAQLTQKQYIVPDGRKWRVGNGVAELFDASADE